MIVVVMGVIQAPIVDFLDISVQCTHYHRMCCWRGPEACCRRHLEWYGCCRVIVLWRFVEPVILVRSVSGDFVEPWRHDFFLRLLVVVVHGGKNGGLP